MQIIKGKAEFQTEGRSAVAIGKFDGIHKGHEQLLSKLLLQKASGLKATVFTFDPPAAAYFGNAEEKELSTALEKRQFFQEMGIDVLVEFPLNEQTASISAEAFIENILIRQLHTAYIAAGNDVSFGYKGQGNKELLLEFADRFDYQAEIIDKVVWKGREISSTYVREEIEAGHMETAAELLGRNYSVKGTVQAGKQLGRKMDVPTLNLYPPQNKLLPPKGVYDSRVLIGKESYPGITNIGSRPTVNESGEISVETCLYDFEGELYGREIEVFLLHFRRPEQKFASMEALKEQMKKDMEEGRIYHGLTETK